MALIGEPELSSDLHGSDAMLIGRHHHTYAIEIPVIAPFAEPGNVCQPAWVK
jgi:hypothetical protein